MLLELERGYPDKERPDSSKELRHGFRAFWGHGEQLWDVDFNNNFKFMSWWMAPKVDLRRTPYPPFQTDSNYYYIPQTGAWANYIMQGGIVSDPTQLPPFTGAFVYVQQDQMFVGYNGATWKPMVFAPEQNRIVEIAMFASDPPAGGIMASHLVEEPFTIPLGAKGSRARNFSKDIVVSVQKNGTEIGTIVTQEGGVGFFTVAAAVPFAAGDRLSIKMPAKIKGSRACSVSIIGYLP